jgi:DNA-binding LacI/PurR family transcriptional regulator
MLLAYRAGGFTMVAIAKHIGLSVARVSRVIAQEDAKEETQRG